MNTKSVSSIALWAIVVALGIVAWREAGQARTMRRAVENLATKEITAQADLRKAIQRQALADQQQRALQQELNAPKKPIGAATQPKAVAPAPAPRSLNILEIIRNEPDTEMLFLEARRSELAAQYGPLFRLLGRSADVEAKFQEIYIQREGTRMDLADVLRHKTTDEDRAAVVKLQAAAEADYEAAQRALLGDEGWAKLQEYDRISLWRGMVSAIAGVAVVEHVPISAEQADALVQAVIDADKRPSVDGGANGEGVDWDRVDERARTILSPDQFVVFRTMDPGPTRPGLLQSRLYARVNAANRVDRTQKPGSAAARKPGD